MALVKGDRIGESQRLNRCSVQAQDFYAAMIAAEVPDDFGRFRDSTQHVWIRMYPRREPTAAGLRRVKKLMSELAAAGLWRTWDVDGVGFAELYNHPTRGNMYHRTPEPPASFYQLPKVPHKHSKRCANTALARAKEWGDLDSVSELLLLVKRIDRTEPEGDPKETRSGGDTEGGTRGRTSVTSVTSNTSNVKRNTGAGAPGRETWLTRPGSRWRERWGTESEPPWGEMGRVFKKPNADLGPDELDARWQRFLAAAKKPAAARPTTFVQELGQWAAPKQLTPHIPKSLRERDDRAMTPEELERIRADRAAAEAGK